MIYVIPVFIFAILVLGWLTDFHYVVNRKVIMLGAPGSSRLVIIFMDGRLMAIEDAPRK